MGSEANRFGTELRRLRDRRGWTQEQLADKAGLSSAAISTLERGARRFPQQQTVRQLADALGLDGQDRDNLLALTPHRIRWQADADERAGLPVPRQLPLAPADFTARSSEVSRLCELLTPTRAGVPVAVISGMGGVGKTALAVQVAHSVAERYPDGQFYVDLQGFSEHKPVAPIDALRGFLRALGGDADGFGEQLTNVSAGFRSMVAGRRVLLLLDNAADTAQVEQLLPGAPGCAVVVTSRRLLDDLPGAKHVQLDALATDDAIELLARVVGRARVDVERESAAVVVAQCGCLPLALMVAGGRLAARPRWPIRHLAERLSDENRRLSELTANRMGVQASLTVSLRPSRGGSDGVDLARSLGLLALPDVPDLSVGLAAPLLDVAEEDAAEILDRLVDVNLIATSAPGCYSMHDLVRSLARIDAAAVVSTADRDAALKALYERIAAVGHRYSELLGYTDVQSVHVRPGWTASAQDFTEPAEAANWLQREEPHLVALIEQAASGPAEHRDLAIRTAIGLGGFLVSRKNWMAWLSVNRSIVGVAEGHPDPVVRAIVRHDMGAALGEIDRFDDGVAELRTGLTAAEASGRSEVLVMTLTMLSHLLERTNKVTEGIAHAERARTLARTLGNTDRISTACLALGMLYAKAGDRRRESARFSEAVASAELDGRRGELGMAHLNMGMVKRETGRCREALPDLSASFRYFMAGLQELSAANALDELGLALLGLGDFDGAIRAQTQGLELAIDHGDLHREASVRCHLGMSLARLGRRREARAEWATALEIRERYGIIGADAVRALLDSAD